MNFFPGVPPLDCECLGGPCDFFSGVPPSATRHVRGGGAGQNSGLGGRSLGRGAAPKILQAPLPPRIFCVQEALQNIFQGFTPLLQGLQEGGALAGMVARVGACWVGAGRRNVSEEFPPGLCVSGRPCNFFPGVPPSAARRARGEGLFWDGCPGGHSLGWFRSRSGSLVPGRKDSSSGEGGVAKFFRGVCPRGDRHPRVPDEIFPGVPP